MVKLRIDQRRAFALLDDTRANCEFVGAWRFVRCVASLSLLRTSPSFQRTKAEMM